MKIVGKRRMRHDCQEFDSLMEMAKDLRGHDLLVPRGVYRFASHEEADEWMSEMTARTHARRAAKTSRGSDAR